MTASVRSIELRDVTQRFQAGRVVAVDHVSLALKADPPQIVSLVGESGSGKSTIARMMLGLQPPTSGSVTLDGKDVYRLSQKDKVSFRRSVQVVFQDPYAIYNPFYTVDRVFWVPIRKLGLAQSEAHGHALIGEALEAVGLRKADVLGRHPHQLSGGQRQRLMLARAYMIRPAFIVADEPVSMLDAGIRALFLNILLDFRERYGMTTLFISHDLSTACYIGQELAIASQGRIVERGPAGDVMLRPAHPYTQLLISSVPVPDPDARWTKRLDIGAGSSTETSVTRDRCLFAERCRFATDRCWRERPEMVSLGDGRSVRCFLYEAGDSSPSGRDDGFLSRRDTEAS